MKAIFKKSFYCGSYCEDKKKCKICRIRDNEEAKDTLGVRHLIGKQTPEQELELELLKIIERYEK